GRDSVRQMGADARAFGNVLRRRRGGGRDLPRQRLFDRAILWLDLGPPQEAMGGAAVHGDVDRPAPSCARDRSHRRRRDDARRVRRALLDSSPSAHLFAAAAARRRQEIYGRPCERPARQDPWLALLCHHHDGRNRCAATVPPYLGRQRMTPDSPIKLVSELLDLPLVDSEGKYCGVVDDVELIGGPGKELKLKALLAGPGAFTGRMPGWAMHLVK